MQTKMGLVDFFNEIEQFIERHFSSMENNENNSEQKKKYSKINKLRLQIKSLHRRQLNYIDERFPVSSKNSPVLSDELEEESESLKLENQELLVSSVVTLCRTFL
jgi:hypothetical protein